MIFANDVRHGRVVHLVDKVEHLNVRSLSSRMIRNLDESLALFISLLMARLFPSSGGFELMILDPLCYSWATAPLLSSKANRLSLLFGHLC